MAGETRILAMTGAGAGPTIPSPVRIGTRRVARGLRIHPANRIIPSFHSRAPYARERRTDCAKQSQFPGGQNEG